jgi:hypothetical protein
LFTSSDRAVCREIVEGPLSKKQSMEAITALAECAEHHGWRVERGPQRWTFYSPDKTQKPLPISVVADKQAIYALVAALRKAGVDVTRDPHEPPEGIKATAEAVDAMTVSVNGTFDLALRDYITSSVEALHTWYEKTEEKIHGEVQAKLQGEISAIETAALESEERAVALQKELDKVAGERARACKERDDLKIEHAAALERALAAENALSSIRNALGVNH